MEAGQNKLTRTARSHNDLTKTGALETPLSLANYRRVSMENVRVFDFKLTGEDVSVLIGLHDGFRGTLHLSAVL